jgi:hypothetical protein
LFNAHAGDGQGQSRTRFAGALFRMHHLNAPNADPA